MLRKYVKAGMHIVLIGLGILVIIAASLRAGRTVEEERLSHVFQGEYRLGDGEWTEMKWDAENGWERDVSAFTGEMAIRGSFPDGISKDTIFSCYLNHISYQILVNGEVLYSSPAWGREASPEYCGKYWDSVTMPEIGPEDVLELRLHNTHIAGNKGAYNEFLSSLTTMPLDVLRQGMEEEGWMDRAFGLLMLILAIGVIGIAFADAGRGKTFENDLWYMGLFSLFAGGYILLDTGSVPAWTDLNIFNNYASLICMMMAKLELGMVISECCRTRLRRASEIVTTLEGFVLGGFAFNCLLGGVALYDLLPAWTKLQMVIGPIQMMICIWEARKCSNQARFILLISAITVLLGIGLEIVNMHCQWWSEELVVKTIVVLLSSIRALIGIWGIPASYQRAKESWTLEEELKDSRIIAAMGQIRAHFIFNVLNAVSGMCKYDPEKADETIVCFSRYLRNNIDILQQDQPISFVSALEHLEDYIWLEHIRFGDRISFETDIQTEDFVLPPLVLQPIVENSIKHGLMGKPNGGTIKLSTWRSGDDVCISVRDDGVGFDIGAMGSDRSVGLNNIRFRLQHAVGGRLDIQSAVGQGTTVTITIPQKGEKE